MAKEKSFFGKLIDFLGGTSTKEIPGSSEFLSKYASVEDKVKIYSELPIQEELPLNATEEIEIEPEVINERYSEQNPSSDNWSDVGTNSDRSQTIIKFCPSCGSKNRDEYKFCTNCGAQNPLLSSSGLNAIIEGVNDSNKNTDNQKKEGKSIGKKILTVILDVVIFLLVAGGVGAAGYWGYLKYLADDSYKRAQYYISKGNWVIAKENLADAILDAQNNKLISTPNHTLSKAEQNKLVVWKAAVTQMLEVVNLANSKRAQERSATVDDYINIFSKYQTIPFLMLKENEFGDINATSSLKSFELTFDSIKLDCIQKLLDSKLCEKLANGSLIYHSQSSQISVDSLLQSVTYPNDPAISPSFVILKGIKEGILNAIPSNSVAPSITKEERHIEPSKSISKTVNEVINNEPSSWQIKEWLVGKELCYVKCLSPDKITNLNLDKPSPNGQGFVLRIHFTITGEDNEQTLCDGDLTYSKNENSYQFKRFASL